MRVNRFILNISKFIPSKVEIPCRVPHCLSLTLIRQCTLSKQCNSDAYSTCAIWENIVDSMVFTPFGSLKFHYANFTVSKSLECYILIQKSKSFDRPCISINTISCYYSDYIHLKNFTGNIKLYRVINKLAVKNTVPKYQPQYFSQIAFYGIVPVK